MFRSGAFVADHLGSVTADQIQPNGVDIRLDSVAVPTGGGHLGREGKTIGERRTVDQSDGQFDLDPGAYVVGYLDEIAVPDGHIGFILPRSSLLRNGATLETAVWDAGYRGRGEGLLRVDAPLTIETEARIGQFVLAAADHEGTYDGSYQGEGLN